MRVFYMSNKMLMENRLQEMVRKEVKKVIQMSKKPNIELIKSTMYKRWGYDK